MDRFENHLFMEIVQLRMKSRLGPRTQVDALPEFLELSGRDVNISYTSAFKDVHQVFKIMMQWRVKQILGKPWIEMVGKPVFALLPELRPRFR